jgi:hypothetical protein
MITKEEMCFLMALDSLSNEELNILFPEESYINPILEKLAQASDGGEDVTKMLRAMAEEINQNR